MLQANINQVFSSQTYVDWKVETALTSEQYRDFVQEDPLSSSKFAGIKVKTNRQIPEAEFLGFVAHP
jgi:hypothetical protein